MRECNISCLFDGGDEADAKGDIEQAKIIKEALLGVESHYAMGNHDWFAHETGSNLAYIYDSGKMNQNGNADRHYYYIDNHQKKIRYIIMSSFSEITPESDPAAGPGYESDQITWLSNVALNVESGWKILIFTHAVYYMHMGTGAFTDIANNSDFLNAVNNYSGNGEIVAIFQGHIHRDTFIYTDSGIPIIVTTCDRNVPYTNAQGYTDINVDRTAGTIKEQAFDVVGVDFNDETIKTIRIGAGNNRIFHYTVLNIVSSVTLTSTLSGTVTWSSSDDNVATVSSGVVSAVGHGSIDIIATNEDEEFEVWHAIVA